mmetsp:Transcript_32925/g.49705  ORF Transcript_32925/g.49705 Transcript_32925/m.49705 type:complete len:220 (-) Transcript_32925:334-993(-)
MFRRTDCHFSIDRSDKDVVKIKSSGVEYTSAMTNFLNGAEGKVYLDTASPRVCIRGPEDITTNDECDIGYKFLPEESVFPFVELRAAAVDRRGCNFISKEFNQKILENMRCRIIAQLVTLMDAGVRHVVLSAFGCGAFRNPADDVAVLYREEIEKRAMHFDVVVFAIFHAGYGPDNFTPFQKVFLGFNGDDGVQSSFAAHMRDSAHFSTPPRQVRQKKC